jgi:hypothetical protein
MEIKEYCARHVTSARLITAVGFIIAVVLVMVFQVRMFGASPWAYYYGVQNFANGQLVIDDTLHTAQQADARDQGGQLMQYVEIGDNQWALEKAPGYVFYLVPFQWLGIPRWGNIVLMLGMAIITFLLLKRMRDEKTACIGSLLMLFTPVTLIMCNLIYMDTFASLAFLVMGGGLYIYHRLERETLRPLVGGLMLFVAFFLISWSVVVRYTNFPVAAVFALHYMIMGLINLRKKMNTLWRTEISAVVLGIGLPIAALLLYDWAVFGSPLDYGYNYSNFPIEFAFQYLGQVNAAGQSVPLQIVWDNIKAAPGALFWGFPLLAIGIPAFCMVLYRKFAPHKNANIVNHWSSLNTELPWDILLILIGWFISVFCLYLTYEFTAEYLGGSSSIRFARFYLPGLFPVVVISALVLARLPKKIFFPIVAAAVITGGFLYFQYMLDGNTSSGSRTGINNPGMHQHSEKPGSLSSDNRTFNPIP